MNRTLAAVVLSLLAVTAGCKRPEKGPEAPSAARPSGAAAPPTAAAPEAPPSEVLAFQAAWGAPPPVRRAMAGASRRGAEAIYTDGKLVPLGGDLYAFVSTGELSDAAHVDAGVLSIHYLRQTANGLERTGAWPEFLSDGSMGQPPTWVARTDLLPAPAILTTGGGVWQGYACTWSHLVELAPNGPVLRTGVVPMSYDNSGAAMDEKDAETMEGEVVPGVRGRSFVVRYAGDRKAEVTYDLAGATYVAATRPDLLTC
jgi:hypothetical protein